MATATVPTLLGAVRRRLWRAQFVAAVRLALWGSAGLMLVAVAVHLGVRPIPAVAVLAALAVLWTALLARAGWRRPADPVCALWADRHLGGASAYATLLEVGHGTPAATNTEAVRWLRDWALARVPGSLRRLAERHESTQLARPLASMLVCAALATLVLSLPDPRPAARQPGATPTPPALDDRPTPTAEPVAAELAGEVANALRSARSQEARQRRDIDPIAGRLPAADPARKDDGAGSPAARTGAAPADEPARGSGSVAAAATDAARAGVTGKAGSAGEGRAAGASRDDRAEDRASPVPRGTMAVRRVQSTARHPSPHRQADTDASAGYDEELAMPPAAAMQADPVAAAAAPPAVTQATPLTATENHYVQAWMRSSQARR